MSTILVDNLTGKTTAGDITVTSEGGAVTMQLQQGLVKQWSSFDQRGTTYGANTSGDTLNTSSQADESTAIVTVNFTNNMSNTTYNVQNSPHYDRTTANKIYARMGAGANVTTSSYLSASANGDGLIDDTLHNSMAVGDLA